MLKISGANLSHSISDLKGGDDVSAVHRIDLAEFDHASHVSQDNETLIIKNSNPIHAVKTKLQVFVGELELTVGELMGAKEHQVLKMKNDIAAPIDLVLEGHVVARGQLVAVDGHFAIRITEIPLPLKS